MSNIQSAVSDSSSKRIKMFSIETLVLCIIAALGSTFCSFLFYDFPLYLDTIFTVALCFCIGPLPAIFVTFVLNPVFMFFTHKYLFGNPVEMYGATTLFALCTLTEIILVFLFHKKIKDREAAFLEKPSLSLFANIAVRLLVLVALDCIVISVTGGLIDTYLTVFSVPPDFWPEDTFKLVLLRSNMSYLAAAILSRIPINIVDRLIAIFCGYGLSLLYKKSRRKNMMKKKALNDVKRF